MTLKEKMLAAVDSLRLKIEHGHFEFLVLVAIQNRAPHCHGWVSGSPTFSSLAKDALERAIGEVDKDTLNRTLPMRDPNLSADYVCYNVANGYLSYDFLNWMIDAEMTRIREGAPWPLKVAFWYGRDGKTGISTLYQVTMLQEVIRPALALIGAVEDNAAMLGRSKELYLFRDIAQAARAGEQVPKFKAPEWAVEAIAGIIGDQPPVTITLREAEHTPQRNSNIDEWLKFARWLAKCGENIIFIRDTAKADEPLVCEFPDCPEASKNLHMRMALYEKAKANLFVSNGPVTLAQYSDRPWLMFHPKTNNNDSYIGGTPAFWEEAQTIPVGSQLPWSRPDQKIVWEEPTFENLVSAWKKLECVDRKRTIQHIRAQDAPPTPKGQVAV